ncbi:Protein translocase subunit SecA [Quillaja saponaria]|uniref:Protein translocase subunit SecA n=1 Tax=Quillaja saponaria TaxID=32244 RepID=A0AAD7PKQ8_QUISA|nr:Protein translocase subunit SecA [Quillaja saponaria]
MELPECPVCLQTYDGDGTIPRVLACGHSVCEACLVQLPQHFTDTVRCPACTQLVKYPTQQGPSALPKNIDLLRICLEHSSSSASSSNNSGKAKQSFENDHPRFWSDEFYATWKDWILPEDVVSIESEPSDDEQPGLCSVLRGRFGSTSKLKGRVCFKDHHSLSLAQIVSLPSVNDSKFKFSYVALMMKCLDGMKEEERNELGLILRVSTKLSRICKAYGLWRDSVDGRLFLVCERHKVNLSGKFDDFRNGFSGGCGDSLNKDGVCGFAMIGINICEALIDLHSEGLVAGSFGLSCFCLDELGGIYVDLNETLVMGRKVRRKIMNAVSTREMVRDRQVGEICNELLKNQVFVCPELLFELLQKEDIALENGCYPVGYNSDVWSLACVLLHLLIGNELFQHVPEINEENSSDLSTWYISWVEGVKSLLEHKLGTEYLFLRQTLYKCLNTNPGSRPHVSDVRKCIRELLIKPQFDVVACVENEVNKDSNCHCLILGELCPLPKERSQAKKDHESHERDNGCHEELDRQGKERIGKSFTGDLSGAMVELKDLQGHLDCITGLAVGGDFLFSSSFDKTVRVWSLQDFSHVHTFRGHEHKVMALAYVDDEPPLCISGDSEGGIFIWGITVPLGEGPLKKWYEQKDWRFSGIHALTISRRRYLYTGSGDRSIKAWSLQNGSLSCTMNGHRSVVSTLSVCDEVLYSGSWDGTIRLWSLNDHSPLAVLGEDMPREMTSVLSITADRHTLVASHENGCVWRNDVYMKSERLHNGAIFAITMQGRWLYTGGWDKVVNFQELSGDEFQFDVKPVGSILSSAVITALLCWQGKIFVGYADKSIKVYYNSN